MGNFYDKLGDVLSSALENGELSDKKDSGSVPEKVAGSRGPSAVQAGRLLGGARKRPQGTVLHAGGKDAARASSYTAPYLVIPENVHHALETLGADSTWTQEKIKSAYHEKLKMFHPDSNSSNETVQKVARQKTAELIDAYEIVTAWLAGR